jgi:hypothetical protein
LLAKDPRQAPWHSTIAFVILEQVSMRVLVAVFVVSLAALVWTILAVRRHIKDHDRRGSEPLRLDRGSDDRLRNPE